MKRITRFSIIGVIGLGLLGGVAACAHHYKDPEHRAEYIYNKINDELSLNEGQQAKLKKLMQVMQQTRKEMHQEFRADHQTIDTLLQQPQLDRQALVNMVHQHTASMDKKAPAIIDAMAGFYDSLDDAQRAKLRQHIAEFRDHAGHGRYHHGAGYDD